jgi:hypothetical protein
MPECAHYHRPILALGAEDNPNNARVPQYPGKGYRECLAWGWIEERTHPHAGYRFFAITPAGDDARSAPKPKRPKRARLAMLPDRVSTADPRLKTLGRT